MKLIDSAIHTLARVTLAATLAAPAVVLHAAEDTDLPLRTAYAGGTPGGEVPWVNVLFRDFSSDPSDFGTCEWIRKTVEVQVTAGGELYDEAPLGGCCPVQGKGNLVGQERLDELLLNFNHLLDIRKLRVYWTGRPMEPGPEGSNTFPDTGLEPALMEIREDHFTAGGRAGRFDIRIKWGGRLKLGRDVGWSKLLFVYDGGNTDISPEDFLVTSKGAQSPSAPFIAVARIKNMTAGPASGWIKN